MSASRLWSASTDSKLGSFRQNSLMPGLTVTCRPIEIGFVWSESLELWLETHVPADRDSVRLVKILIVDDRLRQSFTEFCFRGIDDLIVRYLLSSTFLSSELIQFRPRITCDRHDCFRKEIKSSLHSRQRTRFGTGFPPVFGEPIVILSVPLTGPSEATEDQAGVRAITLPAHRPRREYETVSSPFSRGGGRMSRSLSISIAF